MDINLKKKTGQRIQLLRLEKSLTQEQMGEKLNLSTSAYCKIEYGETDLTLTRLYKIAEVLNISAIELFIKIDSNGQSNQLKDCKFVGITQDNNTINMENNDDLRNLIKANCVMIDMMHKRIDFLENLLNK